MAEGDLNTRLRYEKGLTELSRILFAEESEIDAIQKGIGYLRAAAKADRVYIFENFEDPDDGLCTRQTYETTADDVEPQIRNPKLQKFQYGEEFKRWTELLSRDELISGFVETFPESERVVLERQGVLSILVIPLRTHGKWYGFLGFDHVRSLRRWNENDIRLLQTAGEIIGAFIYRRQAMQQSKLLIQEKELLLREVHHRIKNNLNTVISLLSLQASAADDAKISGALRESISRMQGMLLIYDKLYRSDNYSSVNIDQYLSDLVDDIEALFSLENRITITRKIDRLPVDIKKLYPLGIIINELLTNSLKYAFPDDKPGNITLEAKKSGAVIEIAVSDDGIGIPENFDISRSSGFGLDLVRVLTEQIRGTLKYTGKRGTTFQITAPLN